MLGVGGSFLGFGAGELVVGFGLIFASLFAFEEGLSLLLEAASSLLLEPP